MSITAFRLHFMDGLHIGRGFEEIDKTSYIYGSDALKSALFAVGHPYFENWRSFPDRFFNDFRISSAFPFCGENYFIPRPMGVQFEFGKEASLNDTKIAKKISFITFRDFNEWRKTQKSIAVRMEKLGGGQFLFSEGAGIAFLQTEVQQRVSVNNQKGETIPFYFERIFFRQNAGMYFLADFKNDKIKEEVIQALSILAVNGIGTDRTIGNGLFTFDSAEHFEIPDFDRGEYWMPLGLYCPAREEMNQIKFAESYWGLVKRGGYIAAADESRFRSLRKNNIFFFSEGSVFKSSSPLTGKYVNLRPAYNDESLHPVWRCGMPLFVSY